MQQKVDQKIDENMQKRELAKLRASFYDSLKQHYTSRKYKETINLSCTNHCLKAFREDDLTRSEINCLSACYNKAFRYLGYAGKVYTYIQTGGKDNFEEEEALDLNVGAPPSRFQPIPNQAD